MERAIKDRFNLIRSDMPYAESDQIFVYSEGQISYIETRGLEEVFADELFYIYPTLVLYDGEESKFAVKISPEDAGDYKETIRVIPPADYLVGFHCGSYETIHNTFEKMRQTSEGLLDEGYAISDQVITINIIDQLVEEVRDNFITRVMMRIDH